MSKKERIKAIEICKNLFRTINTMIKVNVVKSQSTAYESYRASKSKLNKLRESLIKKYNIKKKEL
tara:strand:+ start:2856 stop:3050 length:195 start_codon:yes stop_codon:yes gene_type:complete